MAGFGNSVCEFVKPHFDTTMMDLVVSVELQNYLLVSDSIDSNDSLDLRLTYHSVLLLIGEPAQGCPHADISKPIIHFVIGARNF